MGKDVKVGIEGVRSKSVERNNGEGTGKMRLQRVVRVSVCSWRSANHRGTF